MLLLLLKKNVNSKKKLPEGHCSFSFSLTCCTKITTVSLWYKNNTGSLAKASFFNYNEWGLELDPIKINHWSITKRLVQHTPSLLKSALALFIIITKIHERELATSDSQKYHFWVRSLHWFIQSWINLIVFSSTTHWLKEQHAIYKSVYSFSRFFNNFFIPIHFRCHIIYHYATYL